MKICPNCLKELNDNFTYCRQCGCRIESGKKGDFKTEFLNVFFIEDEFVYLFTVNGRQIVLKADSIDKLKEVVKSNKFPWKELENSMLEAKASLRDSVVKDCAIIGASSLERNPAYSNIDKFFK